MRPRALSRGARACSECAELFSDFPPLETVAMLYDLKRVRFGGEERVVVLQNANGPW
jgi:hypothetical protein